MPRRKRRGTRRICRRPPAPPRAAPRGSRWAPRRRARGRWTSTTLVWTRLESWTRRLDSSGHVWIRPRPMHQPRTRHRFLIHKARRHPARGTSPPPPALFPTRVSPETTTTGTIPRGRGCGAVACRARRRAPRIPPAARARRAGRTGGTEKPTAAATPAAATTGTSRAPPREPPDRPHPRRARRRCAPSPARVAFATFEDARARSTRGRSWTRPPPCPRSCRSRRGSCDDAWRRRRRRRARGRGHGRSPTARRASRRGARDAARGGRVPRRDFRRRRPRGDGRRGIPRRGGARAPARPARRRRRAR
mmetsp:Transcript_13185/g.55727  ORF Transcript_13185/g.55727 Transcript_13185/m.55727 type:complete len:306 (-) Transcript_13185:123-1040(-)